MLKKFMFGLIGIIGLGTNFGAAFYLENYLPNRSDTAYVQKITTKIDGIIGKNREVTDILISKLSAFMFQYPAIRNIEEQTKYYILHKVTDYVLVKQQTNEYRQVSEKANLAAEAQNYQLAYDLTKAIPLDANLGEERWASIIQFAHIVEGPEALDSIDQKYAVIYERFADGNIINFIRWLSHADHAIDLTEMQKNAIENDNIENYLPYIYVYIAQHYYDFFHATETMTSEQLEAIFRDETVLNTLLAMEYMAEEETDYINLKDLGSFYQRLGFFEKSQGAYEKAARYQPTYATYASLATSLLWTSCNEERSLELFSKAAVLFEGDSSHPYTHDISRWRDICGNQDSRNDYMKTNKDRRDFLDRMYYSLFDQVEDEEDKE